MSQAPPNEPEDELPTALGKHLRAREQAQVDARAPEWEAVARGDASAEAEIERRRAAGDEHAERVAEYFRPFDADETSALVSGLLAGLEADDAGEVDNVIPLAKPKPKPKPESKPELEPIAQEANPAKGASWWIPAGLLLAVAAALMLWWLAPGQGLPGTGETGPKLTQRDPLPSYTLETDGGLEQLRGDTDGPAPNHSRYRPHTPFEWVLRPSKDASGELAVRGFAFANGGSEGVALQLDALVQIAGTGAIRIAGTIAQLNLEPGRYTIALAVGRPDALPEQSADVVAPTSEDTWAVRRVDIIIEE